jgi:invasion protein IalB
MRAPDVALRRSVWLCVPVLVLGLASASFAAPGDKERGATAPAVGVRLAQQKGAPEKGAPAKAAEEPAAWAVSCTDQVQQKFTCEMTQSLIDQKTQAQVMLISIKNTATGDAKAMLIRMFHGVYLPTGVSVKVDSGQATPIAFQKSDRFGVYAALPLTDRIVADMKKGKDLRFSLQVNQGESLELVARLNGFGPAFDRISAMQ